MDVYKQPSDSAPQQSAGPLSYHNFMDTLVYRSETAETTRQESMELPSYPVPARALDVVDASDAKDWRQAVSIATIAVGTLVVSQALPDSLANQVSGVMGAYEQEVAASRSLNDVDGLIVASIPPSRTVPSETPVLTATPTSTTAVNETSVAPSSATSVRVGTSKPTPTPKPTALASPVSERPKDTPETKHNKDIEEGITPSAPESMAIYGPSGKRKSYITISPTDGTYEGTQVINGVTYPLYAVDPEVGLENGSIDGSYWTKRGMPNTLPDSKVAGTQTGDTTELYAHNSNNPEVALPGKNFPLTKVGDIQVVRTENGATFIYIVKAVGYEQKDAITSREDLTRSESRVLRTFTCRPNAETGDGPEQNFYIVAQLVGAWSVAGKDKKIDVTYFSQTYKTAPAAKTD